MHPPPPRSPPPPRQPRLNFGRPGHFRPRQRPPPRPPMTIRIPSAGAASRSTTPGASTAATSPARRPSRLTRSNGRPSPSRTHGTSTTAPTAGTIIIGASAGIGGSWPSRPRWRASASTFGSAGRAWWPTCTSTGKSSAATAAGSARSASTRPTCSTPATTTCWPCKSTISASRTWHRSRVTLRSLAGCTAAWSYSPCPGCTSPRSTTPARESI